MQNQWNSVKIDIYQERPFEFEIVFFVYFSLHVNM